MSFSFEALGRARGVAAAARAEMAKPALPIEVEEQTRQNLLGEIAKTGEALPADTIIKVSTHGSAWQNTDGLHGCSSKLEIETLYGFLDNPPPAEPEQPAQVEEPKPAA